MSMSGESLGWQGENQSDDDFTWFDQEWEKWKDLPEMQPDYNKNMSEWRARRDQVETVLFDELDARGIRRLVDKDSEQQHWLCQEFLVARHEPKLVEMQRTKEGVNQYINADHHIKAAFTNAVTYRELYRFQEQVMADAAMLRGLVTSASEDPLEVGLLDLEDIKKKIQTRYLLHHMRSMNDPWQVFFDDVTPGDCFDSNRLIDEKYIHEAEEGLAEFRQELQKDRRVLRRAMEIVGVRGVKSDGDAVLRLTVNVVEMLNIATAPNQTNRATRNEQLYHYGHNYGIEGRRLEELANYFDKEYPIDW